MRCPIPSLMDASTCPAHSSVVANRTGSSRQTGQRCDLPPRPPAAHKAMSTQVLNSPSVQMGLLSILLENAQLYERLKELKKAD